MTISTQTSQVTALGNGATTVFNFPFVGVAASDISVVYTTASGTQTTLSPSQYTLILNPALPGQLWGVGGSVTYPLAGSAIANGTSLTITRTLPLVQDVTISNQGDFAPQVIEQGLDKLEMQIQQIGNTQPRAIQIPGADPSTLNTTLPAAAVRANQFVTFDNNGNVIVGGNPSNLPSDLTNYTATATGGNTSRSMGAHFNDRVDVADFGAVGMVSQGDVSGLFTLALAETPLGRETHFKIGEYIWSAGVSVTGPISLVGEGACAGPGGVLNTNCSQILTAFQVGDVLTIGSTLYGSRLEHMQFNSALGQRTSGSTIKLTASGLGSTQANNRLNDLAFNNQAIDIEFYQCGQQVTENTYHQAWRTAAIYSHGDGVHESGIGNITKNYFFGFTSVGTTQPYNLRISHGYTKINENLILGSQIGIYNDIINYPAGAFEVVNNWLEEQDICGVFCVNGGGNAASMLAINWNEFSVASLGAAGRPNWQSNINLVAGSAPWLTTWQIVGNRMRNAVGNGTSTGFIVAATGTRGQICGNNLEGLTGNTTSGIIVGAQATQVDVFDNMMSSNFGLKYSLTTECMLRDFSSRLLAAEVTAITAHNGSSVWCQDGCPGSNPLQGSGAGCIAYLEGGVWRGKSYITAPTAVIAATYVILDTDNAIIANRAGTVALTLPTASHYIGRTIRVRTITANTVTSGASNVVPIIGGAAGTAILAATAGKWADLQSDGTNWQIMASN